MWGVVAFFPVFCFSIQIRAVRKGRRKGFRCHRSKRSRRNRTSLNGTPLVTGTAQANQVFSSAFQDTEE